MRVSAGPSCAAITPHRNALHGQRAGVSVPEDMERRGGFNLGAGARGVQRALLVRQPPCLAIVAEENELALGAPRGPFGEERVPLVRQNDVARFARLALADGYGPRLGVEVSGAHAGQLAVAAARDQGAFHMLRKPPSLAFTIRRHLPSGRTWTTGASASRNGFTLRHASSDATRP